MGRSRLWRVIALVMVMAMVALACGSSADDAVEATDQGGDAAEVADETEESDTEEGDGDGSGPDGSAGVDGPQAGTDDQVSLITGNGWGVDDNNVLVGPSGYTVDLASCPDDWSDTGGITDDEIRLGQSIAQSGTVAVYGTWTDGMRNYFDYINETEGGVDGKALSLIDKDDAYDAVRAVSNVDQLLETENIFAITSQLGTPMNLATYDTINEACVPHLFPGSGHPAWADPEFHPWTVSSAVWLGYNTEGTLWGEYIDTQFDEPVTVAALVLNNDAGVAWEQGFKDYAEANPDVIAGYESERYEADAPTITNEMTTLGATGAEAFILMGGSIYCPQAMDAIAEAAWDPPVKIVPTVCSGIQSFFVPAGQNGNGWALLNNGKDLTDARWDGDEFVELARENLTSGGIDITTGLYGQAYENAWPIVEALKVAAELPGGLTRTNFMLSLRSMNREHPMKLPGISFALDGNADGYTIEGGQFVKYSVEQDQEAGTFAPVGDIFDVNGTTPNCTFGEAPENQC